MTGSRYVTVRLTRLQADVAAGLITTALSGWEPVGRDERRRVLAAENAVERLQEALRDAR